MRSKASTKKKERPWLPFVLMAIPLVIIFVASFCG
jgi:hypothetical protein